MKIYSRILIALLFIPLLCSAGTPPQNVELLSIKAGQGETNAQFYWERCISPDVTV